MLVGLACVCPGLSYGRRFAAEPLKIKRHYSALSGEETDAVVEIIADLIVTFLKGGVVLPDPSPKVRSHTRPVQARAGMQETKA